MNNRSSPKIQNPHALRWEIAGIIIFKLTIILLAGFTVFGAHHRIHVDPTVMSNQLLGSSIQQKQDR